MLLLALDTATARTAVALLEKDQLVAELSEPSHSHSGSLLPLIGRLLQEQGRERASLGAIAVGIGPGSFTGVRVGLATAKTLSFALEIPLVGVSTLRAMAENGKGLGVERITVVQDARKQEVFRSSFLLDRGRGGVFRMVEAEAAESPDALASRLAVGEQPVLLLGSGLLRYQEVFARALGTRLILPVEEQGHWVRAAAVGRLGWEKLAEGHPDDARTLEPLYCRLSEAEMGRLKRGLSLV